MIRAPVVTLERTEPDAPVASSWLFAFLARMGGTLPTVSIWILLAGPSFDQYVARQGGSSEGANAIYVVVAIFCLMVQLLGAVAWPMMGAACDHLSLIIVRARPSSYRVTLHGWALAQGPMLTGLLPLISVYIQPWWTLVLRINAYRVFHRISDSRAFFAVALSMLIAIVLLGIVVALVSSLAALVMIALVQPSSPPA